MTQELELEIHPQEYSEQETGGICETGSITLGTGVFGRE